MKTDNKTTAELHALICQCIQDAKSGKAKLPPNDSPLVQDLMRRHSESQEKVLEWRRENKYLKNELEALVYHWQHGIQDTWPRRTEEDYKEQKTLLESAIAENEAKIDALQREYFVKMLEAYEAYNRAQKQ